MSKIMETEPNKEPFHILVLDDEYSIRWVLERTLSQAGYIPHLATDAPEARQLLRKHAIRQRHYRNSDCFLALSLDNIMARFSQNCGFGAVRINIC